MLHLGHFSFDALDENNQPEHGYFTCLVDADSPKSAVTRFTRHILSLKKTDFAFSHIKRIYLEDIVRVNSVTEQPLVTLLQSSKGPFPRSISYTLPSVDRDDVAAFGLPGDVDNHETEDTDNYVESEPMIDFFQSPVRGGRGSLKPEPGGGNR